MDELNSAISSFIVELVLNKIRLVKFNDIYSKFAYMVN